MGNSNKKAPRHEPRGFFYGWAVGFSGFHAFATETIKTDAFLIFPLGYTLPQVPPVAIHIFRLKFRSKYFSLKTPIGVGAFSDTLPQVPLSFRTKHLSHFVSLHQWFHHLRCVVEKSGNVIRKPPPSSLQRYRRVLREICHSLLHHIITKQ